MKREEVIEQLEYLIEKCYGKDVEALEYAIKELTAQEVPVQEQLEDSITTQIGNTKVVISKDELKLKV